MSGIARGRIPVANPFQLRGFGMKDSFQQLFIRIAVRMLSNRDVELTPKQLEASQLPVTPPENLVELRGIEPLTLRLPVSRKGKK